MWCGASDGTVSWHGPDRVIVLTVADRRPTAHVRCDMTADPTPDDRIELAAYTSRLAVLERSIVETPAATGARGEAVERLRAHLAGRCAQLAGLLALARQIAPDAPILERSLTALAGPVELLAAHERRLAGEHDWCDALVIGDDEKQPHGDSLDFGWTMQLAVERAPAPFGPERRVVRLHEGPFAYGIHRVLRQAHELYPAGDHPAIHAVTLEDPAELAARDAPAWLADYDPAWLRALEACIATLGEHRVILSSIRGDTRRIASLLVCARAAAATAAAR